MARDGSGNYSLPANTLAVSGDPISSTKFNSLVQDLESDANVDRPIAAGGTGASTAQAALTNLFSGASPGGADKIAFWDQSATAFGWLALGTGLAFNGTTLELDADLSTLAGLTVVADNFIVGNSGGTAWEVKTPSQARTSLGLVIGTNVQAFNARLADVSGLAVTDGGFIVGNGSNFVLETGATAQASLGYTASDVLTKLLTVDGAGSGLDADTLDGVQGSAYVAIAGTQTITGLKFFQTASQTADGIRVSNSTDGVRTHLFPGKVGAQNANLLLDSQDGFNVIIQSAATALATFTPTGASFAQPLQARPAASTETSGTLTSASANKTIQATGNITIPNSVFAAGDCILIYAGASSRTITQGSGVTMRLGGTATTGSRSLAARGVAVLFFVSASEVVVSGSGVT